MRRYKVSYRTDRRSIGAHNREFVIMKRLEDMTQAEIEEIFAFDSLFYPNQSMTRRWRCFQCQEQVSFSVPAPCSKCGGTAFQEVEPTLH